jgi:hypothetical protein
MTLFFIEAILRFLAVRVSESAPLLAGTMSPLETRSNVQKAGRAFAIAENPRIVTETHDGAHARSSPPTAASIASRPDRRFPTGTRARNVFGPARGPRSVISRAASRTLTNPSP